MSWDVDQTETDDFLKDLKQIDAPFSYFIKQDAIYKLIRDKNHSTIN